MADDLCLFSFEIFVERINYLKSHCIEPAVAFRLLDYPTIIIYISIPEASAVELSANIVSPGDQKDENKLHNFIFHKGKSCLFKIGYKEFKSMLYKAPLYVMILDCVDKKPKLLGTCSIPLLSLLSQITNDAENHKYESPSYGTEKNTYNIFNLMSTHIGSVNLNLKLTCFGKSLLKHITVNNRKESKIDALLDLKKTKEDEAELVLVPPTGVEYKKDNNRDVKLQSVTDKSTQCKRTSRHKKKNNYEKQQNKKESVCEIDYTNNFDTVETENIIYPPPLYINLYVNEEKEAIKTVNNNNDQLNIKERRTYLLETKYSDYESLSSDEEPYIEIIQPNQQKYYSSKTKRIEPINQSNKDVVTQTDVVQPLVSSTNSNIINAPILNSLLQEIVSILTLNQKTSTCNGECQQIKTLGDTSNNIDKNNIKSLDTKNSKDKTKLEKGNNIAKSNLNNKNQKFPLRKGLNKKTKKLKYGPTRTQKLRYLITHPKQEDVLRKQHLNTEDEAKSNQHHIKDSAIPVDYFKESIDVVKINKSDDSFDVLSKISDVENDKETVLSEEKPNLRYSSLSFTIPTPEVDYSSHDSDNELSKEAANSIAEMKVGFYSPKVELKLTPTALGEFDDEKPWSSEHIYDETFEKDDDSKSNKSAISESSSISLPNASERTISSNEGDNVKASSLGRSKSALQLHYSRQSKHSLSNRTNSKQSVSKLSMYSNSSNKMSIESPNDNNSWKNSRSKSNVSHLSSGLSIYSANDTNISFQENEPVKSKYSPVKSKQFSKKQLSRETSMSYGTTSFNSIQS